MKTPLLYFLILVVGLITLFGYNSFMNKTKTDFSLNQSQTPVPSPTPQASGNQSGEPQLPEVIKATMTTDKGVISLELYPKIAPKTVINFVKLGQEKFYDGTKFHRVIPEFMIQGGDPLSKTNDPNVGSGEPGYKFEDEINPKALGLTDDQIKQLEAQGYKYDFTLKSLPVDVGSIAMANSGPNTNGSQFFIVTQQPQPHLNGKHTVFGKVVAGMDVVRKIQQGDKILKIEFSK